MHRLRNPVRHYAWGSPTAIPELLGEEPDGQPHAELWLGAHPGEPSHIDHADELTPLYEAISRDVPRWLGAVERSDGSEGAAEPRLPFLLKVLAADEPLSLQVHPSRQRAKDGYAAEEERGLASDAPERSYRDENHKPEMICALTVFRLAAGYRPASEVAALLASLDVAVLQEDVVTLRGNDEVGALHAVLARWLRLDGPGAAALVGEVAAAASLALRGQTPYERELTNIVELAKRHPDDVGVVVTTLLHHLQLVPGEAVFSPAGALHTYLSGTGIEIMACSDNVVRAGLTSKHVDGEAVLELVDIRPGPPQLVTPRRAASGVDVYDVPVEDFELRRVQLTAAAPVALEAGRPQILLVAAGNVEAQAGWQRLTLSKGQSVVVAAAEPAVHLIGAGLVFCATTGG